MKIDRNKLKKSTSEVPVECQALIDKLKACRQDELLQELKKIDTWTFGKCELYHWIDILDICDDILEEATKRTGPWVLTCDLPHKRQLKELLLWVLHFTTLLIEHSFSRHLYNSMEHLITLLSSSDMHVILGVLNLLYMFSKRSNFIPRLSTDKRHALIRRLNYLAESWGGKENGFGLAECCKDFPVEDHLQWKCLCFENKDFSTEDDSNEDRKRFICIIELCKHRDFRQLDLFKLHFGPGARTLHFEYYTSASEAGIPTGKGKNNGNVVVSIHLEHVDKMKMALGEIMEFLLSTYNVPEDKQMLLFTHLRLAYCFSKYGQRLLCVQAHLQALSVLVYSNAIMESSQQLLYPGLMEELVELLELELQRPHMVEIRSAALRTMTSIIHLERNPQLPNLKMIIRVTGASSYHGFLPTLVRTCITSLTSTSNHAVDASNSAVALPAQQPEFPLLLATALFSFLYHMASYEAGGEALVRCGMMESLLRVIKWPGSELEHITFVTRAVRVIDLITNNDMQSFQMHGGLASFISRLEMEVNICRKEQPFVIKPYMDTFHELDQEDRADHGIQEGASNAQENVATMDVEITEPDMEPSASNESGCEGASNVPKQTKPCLPQRAALLKSMLNFLKKTIQDLAFSDSIRHIMDGSLPASLKHIISNAEYYGPSLFLLATDVVTVYVFQEPSLLSSLQDKGLTDVMLHALLVKEVPATREVLGSLPNVFSALCLNTRGLDAFVKCCPFERLFKVLLSPVYLAAMRRRRSSDPIGDTASNLGNAMDELMRHQPKLKKDATAAIIKLLNELCDLGRDPKYICWRPQSKAEVSAAILRTGTEGCNSDDEEEDDDETTQSRSEEAEEQPVAASMERVPIPLVDYIVNVMKFVDAILSNNSTDDHCKEFVAQKGLCPLVSILGLPNLPVDCPTFTSAQAVAPVCKSILNIAHEPQVLEEALSQVDALLRELARQLGPDKDSGNSVTSSHVLRELVNSSNPDAVNIPSETPLLHCISAIQNYTVMLIHICRTGQADVRNLNLCKWGSVEGRKCLEMYMLAYSLILSETNMLLSLCGDEINDPRSEFGLEDLEKLRLPEEKIVMQHKSKYWIILPPEDNGMTSAMEALSTDPSWKMDIDPEENPHFTVRFEDVKRPIPSPNQLQHVNALLSITTRLGKTMNELFSLLVKLCVGSPLHRRRSQVGTLSEAAASYAYDVVRGVGLIFNIQVYPNKKPPQISNLLELADVNAVLGQINPMLFDDKKFPYHLMLSEFINKNAHNNLLKTLRRVVNSVNPQEGIKPENIPWSSSAAKFLELYFDLLEKLVNPKTLLDSPHSLTAKANSCLQRPFDTIQYLTTMQRIAFDSLMLVWNRHQKFLERVGPRITSVCLLIWRHILRAEKVIEAQHQKNEEPTAATIAKALEGNRNNAPTAATSAPAAQRSGDDLDPEVSVEFLNRLVDMGFSRAMSIQALRISPTVEQATEYLLNAPSVTMEMDTTEPSEEDQLHQAIVMSLGQSDSANPKDAADVSDDTNLSYDEEVEEVESLSKEELDKFTFDAPSMCLFILDILGSPPVFRVCDLLVIILKRNGEEFRDKMLRTILNEVSDFTQSMVKKINESDKISETEKTMQKTEVASAKTDVLTDVLMYSEASQSTAARLHVFSLLFEEIKVPAALIVHELNIIDKLMYLLRVSELYFSQAHTPKWLAPMLLLIDLYEKVAVSTIRKELMNKLCSPQWKWYDLSTGKWCNYSSTHNTMINESYWNGEPSLRITYGRRKYTIQFSCMYQCTDDTGSRRPIMMELYDDIRENQKVTSAERGVPVKDKAEDAEMEEVDGVFSADRLVKEGINSRWTRGFIHGLDHATCLMLIKSCVYMLELPIENDALHAMMRVCLRITRKYEYAIHFANMGGVKLLLGLTYASQFAGFGSLSTLLIRHVIEAPPILHLAIEKVLKSKTAPSIPPEYKELFYMLRMCGNAICRDPEIFLKVARDSLRVDVSLLSRRNEEEDTRLLLKTIPAVPPPTNALTEKHSRQVIQDLLNALAQPIQVDYGETKSEEQETTSSSGTSSCTSGTGAHPGIVGAGAHPGIVGAGAHPGIVATGAHPGLAGAGPHPAIGGATAHPAIVSVTAANPGSQSPPIQRHAIALLGLPPLPELVRSSEIQHNLRPEELAEKRNSPKRVPIENTSRPIFPRSAILKLLAEAVRSYGHVCKIIINHTYSPGISIDIQDECTALCFILDHFLQDRHYTRDSDCAGMARMLIAALASCNHSPETQTTLVSEVKSALLRTLAMPESLDKHNQIQQLCNLICVMIDNCPTTGANVPPPGSKPNNNCTMPNNIVRLMLRKGLILDLARIPHSLDLSSPNMPLTVNAALKPLEALSRIVNHPAPPTQNTKGGKHKGHSTATQGTGAQRAGGSSTSDATLAQGEEAPEDTENTDHDISASAETLEPTSEAGGTAHGTSVSEFMEHMFEETHQRNLERTSHEMMDTEANQIDIVGSGDHNPAARTGFSRHESQGGEETSEHFDSSAAEEEDDEEEEEEEEDEEETTNRNRETTSGSAGNGTQNSGTLAAVRAAAVMVAAAAVAAGEVDDDDDDEEEELEEEDGMEEDEEAEEESEVDAEEDEDDDDDDDDDDEEGEENEEDEEGGSGYEDIFESDDGIFRVPGLDRENHDDIFMIQYSEPDPAMPLVLNDNNRSFQLPHDIFEEPLNETSGVSHFPAQHPLMRFRANSLDVGNVPPTRAQRANRQRRYQYLQVNARNPNPPVILQRLLGPGVHDLPLSASQALASTFRDTRVVVMDSSIRDLFFDEEREREQPGYLFGPGLPANLNSIPNALHWWNEEGKLLDGDSMSACVIVACAELVGRLEFFRDKELSERKEKKKKQAEEEEEKKKKVLDTKPVSESKMDVNQSPGVTADDIARHTTALQIAASEMTSMLTSVMRATVASNAPPNHTNSNSVPAPASNFNAEGRRVEAVTTSTQTSDVIYLNPSNIGSSPNIENSFDSISESAENTAATSSANRTAPDGRPLDIRDISESGMSLGALIDAYTVPSLYRSNTNDQQFMFSYDSDTSTVPAPMETLSMPSSPVSSPNATENLDDSLLVNVTNTSTEEAPEAGPSQANARSAVPMDVSRATFRDSPIELNGQEGDQSRRSIFEELNLQEHEQPRRSIFEELDIEAAETWFRNQIRVQPRLSPTPSEGAAEQGTSAETETAANDEIEVIEDPITSDVPPPENAPSANSVDVPEGVDPSFLAALPEEMRQEVIAEQLRLQRLQQRARSNMGSSSENDLASVLEVNPEFLAALPPNIQEEVLTQQRLEQQRQAAAAANPNDPVDAVAFFQNLGPSLRQTILTDLEESQISALPPDLAAEAQSLRRDWEARNRQIMEERFFNHVSHGNNALSSILRNPGRVAGRYAIHSVPQRQWGPWNRPISALDPFFFGHEEVKYKGRLVLDQETISCLLVLLFIDDPKFNLKGLHRVIKNLCFHPPTRHWVTKALTAILEKCSECHSLDLSNYVSHPGARTVIEPCSSSHKLAVRHIDSCPRYGRVPQQSWLNITMDTALGSRANVFYILRPNGKKSSGDKQSTLPTILIHPQSTASVAKRTLESFVALAIEFPLFYMPRRPKNKKEKEHQSGPSTSSGSACGAGGSKSSKFDSEFWDVLIKLDQMSATKKGKSVTRTHISSGAADATPAKSTNVSSHFQQILSMMDNNLIRCSTQLTDRMLFLANLMAQGLTETQSVQPAVIPTGWDMSVQTLIAQHRQNTAPPGVSTANVPVTDPPTFYYLKQPLKKVQNLRILEIPEHLLKLAVDVLTSNRCSQEALSEAQAFLLNLSSVNDQTRDMILKVLVDGARELGKVVRQHIEALMEQLQEMNEKMLKEKGSEVDEEDTSHMDRSMKGKLQDRFTNTTVIINAPAKPKGGRELQLPAIADLTSKTSSQSYFLRCLKVMLKVRDAVKLNYKNRYQKRDAEAAAAATAADSDAPAAQPSTGQQTSAAPVQPTNIAATTIPAGSFAGPSATNQSINNQDSMDTAVPYVDPYTGLQCLSEQLNVDTLWETLSLCLSELEHTPDHYAVLVLQPAVEAFFLVHSDSIDRYAIHNPRRAEQSSENTQENQLPTDANMAGEAGENNRELAPVSPLPGEGDASSTSGSSSSSSSSAGPQPVNEEVPAQSVTTPAAEIPAQPAAFVSDIRKFLKFAEMHRTVLNQILRQSTLHLADGPFAVLVHHTRMLDFDIKRRYFRTELDRRDEGIRRDEIAVHVRRSQVFEDSFRELHRRSADEWKNRFYIVFDGEEGQDAGGLLREWYVIISREIFNPMYALFTTSPGDCVTYMINSTSHCNPNHLSYFKFVGRVIAKAIYDNKLLECYFTRSFYKHILGIQVKYTDMECEDYSFYQGLVYLMEHDVADLGYDVTFSTEVQEFGVTEVRDLLPNGRNIAVTESNKMEYVRLVCQMKMTGAIRKQMNAFLEGFYDIIPKRLISIFNEQELELLISGLPNIDIEDLKANTEYHKYQSNSLQIQWFWRALRSFDQADRAKFLQFVTGTSKVPLQGFGALEGMNGVQKFQIHRDDRSTDRLPSAHTCFNQLDLPVYETYDKLRSYLLKAIHECSEGFGFA